MHSTISSLLKLSTKIAIGFNKQLPPARTLAAAIDFSKAFDCIPHNLLLTKISNSPLHNNIIRWLAAYLRGRMASCSYNFSFSKSYMVHTGVPQGSVISPILFNFYLSDLPQHDEPNDSCDADKDTYADDALSSHSSHIIPISEGHVNSDLDSISTWSDLNGLSIAPHKSSITIFTPDKSQSNYYPNIHINGIPFPLDKTPKFLGVTYDTHFTFTPHVDNLVARVSSRLKLLKCLAGTTWGHQKETLLLTFKAIIRPLFTYASSAWFPNAFPTSIAKLQTLQNQIFRVCTGCVGSSSLSHLHNETKFLPVKEHLELLCTQYLASSLRPNHPNFPTVTKSSGPRNKKHTLQSRFFPQLEPFLAPDGTTPPDSYKTILKQLHTYAVGEAMEALEPNCVLNSPPPEINDTEITLPRPYRTTLSQLRSGWCSKLNSYLFLIKVSPTNLCPLCRSTEDSVDHLFSCPTHPTPLTPEDLWHSPLEVAQFLKNHPSFSAHLPPLPRPPPGTSTQPLKTSDKLGPTNDDPGHGKKQQQH